MLLSKEKIKEALEYYSIKDIDYYEKCNRCIDETNNNKKIYDYPEADPCGEASGGKWLCLCERGLLYDQLHFKHIKKAC